jgi:hypothetical protein
VQLNRKINQTESRNQRGRRLFSASVASKKKDVGFLINLEKTRDSDGKNYINFTPSRKTPSRQSAVPTQDQTRVADGAKSVGKSHLLAYYREHREHILQ